MKILFLSTKAPLPTNDGHSLRTFNLLRQVARNHEVYLISFVKFDTEYRYLEDMRALCNYVAYFPVKENRSRIQLVLSLLRNLFSTKPFVLQKYDQDNMRREIQALVNRISFDIIHVDMLPLACFLDLFGCIPLVLNAHNVESALLSRQVVAESNILRRWYFSIQQRRLACFEQAIFQKATHVAVCSEQERYLAMEIAPKGNFSVVPNGVDTDFFRANEQPISNQQDLVFVGGLNWYPNLHGLKWFDKEVMPTLRLECPTVKLHIIGRKVKGITWCHPENILVHGFVDDIRPYIERASVFVVPLRIGGGTRLKVLDAMAMGKAIVSTTIGAEGLGTTDGVNIRLADTAEIFASETLACLRNATISKELGKNAVVHVNTNFRWEPIGEKLLDVYFSSINLRKN